MRSKLYRSRLQTFERQTYYSLEEGVKKLKSMPTAKFDETVELAFRLGIDPRQSDQNIRGAMVLPRGTGKVNRVVVIAEGEFALRAKEAGADEVGYEELIQRIRDGWFEFDILIATPSAMKEVRTLGRILGPRGLMPNPKTGTVTENVASAVQDGKGGRIEYRCDRAGCVHVPIGKLSFEPEALIENAQAVLATILRVRPPGAKGIYMQAWTLSSTMSPGIRLDPKAAAKA